MLWMFFFTPQTNKKCMFYAIVSLLICLVVLLVLCKFSYVLDRKTSWNLLLRVWLLMLYVLCELHVNLSEMH